ncbi:MAG: bifunctional 3-deoxy-7-phosphoheptulonate synthase/chorismate mutase type II, partial [Bacteroidales bacterium]|nr:bifunctional 3-deoxy-7-phosphoheptulonate synthase/chorismate mutase type II [Bacteroidales bacterium]
LLIEFKRTHREIPVYCDPSHIAGKRKYVFEIAQKALFLDVDGLMTEVHPYPAKALSDKEQQLSVSEYVAMTDKLLMPSISELQSASLEKYREALDAIDNNIIYLLAERFEVVKKIACYKKENNLPVLQINRWENMRSHILSTAQEAHLDAAFITAYLELLHNASIQYQQEIIREHQ